MVSLTDDEQGHMIAAEIELACQIIDVLLGDIGSFELLTPQLAADHVIQSRVFRRPAERQVSCDQGHGLHRPRIADQVGDRQLAVVAPDGADDQADRQSGCIRLGIEDLEAPILVCAARTQCDLDTNSTFQHSDPRLSNGHTLNADQSSADQITIALLRIQGRIDDPRRSGINDARRRQTVPALKGADGLAGGMTEVDLGLRDIKAEPAQFRLEQFDIVSAHVGLK